MARLGTTLWSQAYFPFSKYNVQSLYPSLVLKSVPSGQEETRWNIVICEPRGVFNILLAKYYRSRSQNSLLWYGQCCSTPLGQLHPASLG